MNGEDSSGNIENLDRVRQMYEELKAKEFGKAVFMLPLASYVPGFDYGTFLQTIETYPGYKARISEDKGIYEFELDREYSLRFLRLCVTGIGLVKGHPAQDLKLKEIIDATEIPEEYVMPDISGLSVVEKNTRLEKRMAEGPGKEGRYHLVKPKGPS